METKRESTARFHRQLGIVDPLKLEELTISIIGCGAIGSMTAIFLAKMGVGNIMLWDGDKIEEHNLPNQFYPESAIGQHKVYALANCIDSYDETVNCKSHAIAFKPGENEIQADIVISAVDSMETRKAIWEKSVKRKIRIKKFIDTRMGGESYRVYCLRPSDPKAGDEYEKTLYSDAEADETPCTERAIIYNIGTISSVVAMMVKRHVTGEEIPFEILGDLKNLIFYGNKVE